MSGTTQCTYLDAGDTERMIMFTCTHKVIQMVPLENQHLLNLSDSHKSSEILLDQLDGKEY